MTDAMPEQLALARKIVSRPARREGERVMNWQPIETCPQEGHFLVNQDGAIRTMMRFDGRWELPDIPILTDKVGNRLVAREVQEYRGETMEINCCVWEPTHWMEIPDAPEAP